MRNKRPRVWWLSRIRKRARARRPSVFPASSASPPWRNELRICLTHKLRQQRRRQRAKQHYELTSELSTTTSSERARAKGRGPGKPATSTEEGGAEVGVEGWGELWDNDSVAETRFICEEVLRRVVRNKVSRMSYVARDRILSCTEQSA